MWRGTITLAIPAPRTSWRWAVGKTPGGRVLVVGSLLAGYGRLGLTPNEYDQLDEQFQRDEARLQAEHPDRELVPPPLRVRVRLAGWPSHVGMLLTAPIDGLFINQRSVFWFLGRIPRSKREVRGE